MPEIGISLSTLFHNSWSGAVLKGTIGQFTLDIIGLLLALFCRVLGKMFKCSTELFPLNWERNRAYAEIGLNVGE